VIVTDRTTEGKNIERLFPQFFPPPPPPPRPPSSPLSPLIIPSTTPSSFTRSFCAGIFAFWDDLASEPLTATSYASTLYYAASGALHIFQWSEFFFYQEEAPFGTVQLILDTNTG
jgi:hypothetical protein